MLKAGHTAECWRTKIWAKHLEFFLRSHENLLGIELRKRWDNSSTSFCIGFQLAPLLLTAVGYNRRYAIKVGVQVDQLVDRDPALHMYLYVCKVVPYGNIRCGRWVTSWLKRVGLEGIEGGRAIKSLRGSSVSYHGGTCVVLRCLNVMGFSMIAL